MMKIKTKLILGCLVVALLTGVVGYLSVRLTHTFQDAFHDMAEDELPITEALHDLKFAGMRIISSANEYAFLVKARSVHHAGHKPEKDELEEIQSGLELYRKTFERYDHLVRTQWRAPEEKVAFSVIKGSGERLIKASRAFIDAVKRGGPDSELIELKEKLEMAERHFLSALDMDIAQEMKEVKKNHELLDISIQNNTNIIIIAAIATFLFAIAGGALISASISRPITKLKEAAEKIGRGELDAVIPSRSRDEVGALAATFNHMAENLRRSQTVLKRRLDLEETISVISSRFVGIIDIDHAINAALEDIGTLSGADRAYLFLYNDDKATMHYAYEWCATGVDPAINVMPELPLNTFPWWMEKLGNHEVINIMDVSAMPPEAENEKRTLMLQDIKSILVLPVDARGKLIGFAGFDNTAGTGGLGEDDLMLLRMFAEIVGSAIERKGADEKLLRYADELKETNEELKSFAYIVSHDLRAPLVSIKGFSFELQESVKELKACFERQLPVLSEQDRKAMEPLLCKDIPESLAFIGSSAVRMDSLINSILTLSRIGRRELKPEKLDMNGLVKAILDSLAHQISGGRVKVTAGALPELTADRLSLEQIIGNLLDNAVKYLDPAGPGELEITAEHVAGETVFHIRDNGRGIAKEDIPKAFEVFRRVGKQDASGEGMGLPYAKTLVKRHGGRIWCESEPGKGSVFSFTIPHKG